ARPLLPSHARSFRPMRTPSDNNFRPPVRDNVMAPARAGRDLQAGLDWIAGPWHSSAALARKWRRFRSSRTMVSSDRWDRRPFGSTGYAADRPRMDDELRAAVRACLLALRELGPEFDQTATDAFLDRVLRTYDRRMARQRLHHEPSAASSLWRAGAILAGGLLALAALFGLSAGGGRWLSPHLD